MLFLISRSCFCQPWKSCCQVEPATLTNFKQIFSFLTNFDLFLNYWRGGGGGCYQLPECRLVIEPICQQDI